MRGRAPALVAAMIALALPLPPAIAGTALCGQPGLRIPKPGEPPIRDDADCGKICHAGCRERRRHARRAG